MLENFIDRHLEKQGFIRVPKGWSMDFEELVVKNRTLSKLLREMGREYNEMLKEIAEHKTARQITKELKETGTEISTKTKEELVELYIKTFSVEFEDDSDEEVK